MLCSAHRQTNRPSGTESFDPSKHSVIFQFNQGDTLRKEITNIEVEIMGVADNSITITQVTDVKSGSVNDVITPNRNLKIKGYKVKIAGDNPAVGVSFFNETTATTYPVDPSDMVTNNPSELIIITPTLPAGTYTLKVTSQYSGSVMLKEPRTATFDKPLTVK